MNVSLTWSFLLRDLWSGMKVEEHNNVGQENIIYGRAGVEGAKCNVAEY